jgi:hypothetical protein
VAAVAVVAAGFTGGSAVGRHVGPLPASPGPREGRPERHAPATPTAIEHEAPAAASTPAAAPTGLLATEAGYTLVPATTTLSGAPGEVLTFRIVDTAGSALTEVVTDHERDLHLVLVSRNLLVYDHLHPTLGPDGTWSAALPALPPAAYHGYASFVPAGGPDGPLTLGVDLLVPGELTAVPLPETGPVVEVDGYTVRLEGTPVAGAGSILTFVVEQAGVPVGDLDPYLGATAHLVAIRVADLAYTHAHPVDAAGAAGAPGGRGPRVPFHVELGAAGDHRLFLDFSHHGIVHTAAFTVHVPPEPG